MDVVLSIAHDAEHSGNDSQRKNRLQSYPPHSPLFEFLSLDFALTLSLSLSLSLSLTFLLTCSPIHGFSLASSRTVSRRRRFYGSEEARVGGFSRVDFKSFEEEKNTL